MQRYHCLASTHTPVPSYVGGVRILRIAMHLQPISTAEALAVLLECLSDRLGHDDPTSHTSQQHLHTPTAILADSPTRPASVRFTSFGGRRLMETRGSRKRASPPRHSTCMLAITISSLSSAVYRVHQRMRVCSLSSIRPEAFPSRDGREVWGW